MKVNTDIDIDVADRSLILPKIKHIVAKIRNKDGETHHNSGVYFQNMLVDPINGLSVLDHNEAENHGFFKIDFLNNTLYDNIESEDHLIRLMTEEPIWELLLEEEIISQLAHIHSSLTLVQKIQPKSVEDLAVVIALMRPGKFYLTNSTRDEIDKNIWKPEVGFFFKKSHAIAYATSIVVQLNELCERMMSEQE